MEKLVIRRSEWARGIFSSALLDDSNKKCCLGFWAFQKGYTRDQIYNRRTPAALANNCGPLPGTELFLHKTNGGYHLNSGACNTVMAINDDEKISDFERELKLKEHFKNRFNIDLEFVD